MWLPFFINYRSFSVGHLCFGLFSVLLCCAVLCLVAVVSSVRRADGNHGDDDDDGSNGSSSSSIVLAIRFHSCLYVRALNPSMSLCVCVFGSVLFRSHIYCNQFFMCDSSATVPTKLDFRSVFECANA